MARYVNGRVQAGAAEKGTIDEIKHAVSLFDRHPNLFRKLVKPEAWSADIYRWNPGLLTALARQIEQKGEHDPQAGLKVLADTDRFWVVRPTTHAASVWFAHHFESDIDARWCSSAYNTDIHFRDHKRAGITFIWDKIRRKKYAVIPRRGVWTSDNKRLAPGQVSRILGAELAKELGLTAPATNPEIERKATRMGYELWGDPQRGVNLFQKWRESHPEFQNDPEWFTTFRKFLKQSFEEPVAARVMALMIAKDVSRGGTVEDGIERFRQREREMRVNYINDYLMSRMNPYLAQMGGTAD